jgi:hypothetical protein
MHRPLDRSLLVKSPDVFRGLGKKTMPIGILVFDNGDGF